MEETYSWVEWASGRALWCWMSLSLSWNLKCWKISIYNEERSHKQSQNTSLYKRDQLIIRKLNSIAKRIFTVAFHEQQFFWQGNNNPLIYHCTFYGSLFPAENLTQIYTTFYPAIANLCHSVASLCLHLHGNISLLQILISQ